MSLTSKLPERYEDLDESKRLKCENVIVNLNNGMNIVPACELADIGNVAFYRYKNLYPWIGQAMAVIRSARTQVAEDALFKSVTGYDYETTETRTEEIVDEDGEATGRKKIRKTLKRVHVSPVVTAAIFWLKNRSGGEWRNDQYIEINSTHTERREVALELAVKDLVAKTGNEDLRQLAEMGERLVLEVEAKTNKEKDDE